MPSSEKKRRKLRVHAALANSPWQMATLQMLCGCEDCRQALQWGYKNGGAKPKPLPRLYYMRSDIIDVKGRDKMVVVNFGKMGP